MQEQIERAFTYRRKIRVEGFADLLDKPDADMWVHGLLTLFELTASQYPEGTPMLVVWDDDSISLGKDEGQHGDAFADAPS